MMNICPGCSTQLNKASKFCSNCGESTNPNKTVTDVKHVYVPYSASKDESTEGDTSEEGSDKAKGILIGLGILVGLGFLIAFFANLGGDSQQNYPSHSGITIEDLQQLQQQQQNFERSQQFFRDAERYSDYMKAAQNLGLISSVC